MLKRILLRNLFTQKCYAANTDSKKDRKCLRFFDEGNYNIVIACLLVDLLRKKIFIVNDKNGFDPIQKLKHPEFVTDIISIIVSLTYQVIVKLKNFCSGVLNNCSGVQTV